MAYPPTLESQLFTAAQRGEQDAVGVLLRSGANAGTSKDSSTGWSALAAALIGGHSHVAEMLLQAGCVHMHTIMSSCTRLFSSP